MSNKIPDEIMAQIIEQWLGIQEAMALADQLWRKNPQQAALALAIAWGSFATEAARTREAMGEPNVRSPLETVGHLMAAMLDLDAGKVDPMLAPTREEGRGPGNLGVALSAAIQRAPIAATIELLMARDPKRRRPGAMVSTGRRNRVVTVARAGRAPRAR